MFLTKWLGDAWDTMTNQKHSSIKLAFIQCGVLNAIDGSEDNLITWPSRDLEVAYTVRWKRRSRRVKRRRVRRLRSPHSKGTYAGREGGGSVVENGLSSTSQRCRPGI